MKYVIDSSVGVKWVIPEVDSAKALRLCDDCRIGASNSSPRISTPPGRQFHHPSRTTSAYHPGRGGCRLARHSRPPAPTGECAAVPAACVCDLLADTVGGSCPVTVRESAPSGQPQAGTSCKPMI